MVLWWLSLPTYIHASPRLVRYFFHCSVPIPEDDLTRFVVEHPMIECQPLLSGPKQSWSTRRFLMQPRAARIACEPGMGWLGNAKGEEVRIHFLFVLAGHQCRELMRILRVTVHSLHPLWFLHDLQSCNGQSHPPKKPDHPLTGFSSFSHSEVHLFHTWNFLRVLFFRSAA